MIKKEKLRLNYFNESVKKKPQTNQDARIHLNRDGKN